MAVRIKHEEYVDVGEHMIDYYGLSTDTKPTEGLVTGSTFFEIDTGTTYYFDEDGDAGSEWVDPTAS